MDIRINGGELFGNLHKLQLAAMEKLVEKFLEQNPSVPIHEINLITEYPVMGTIIMRLERRVG